jgi:hypothetical protein
MWAVAPNTKETYAKTLYRACPARTPVEMLKKIEDRKAISSISYVPF